MITFLLVTCVVMLGLGLVSYLSEKRVNTSKEASALSLLPGDIKYESPNGRFRFFFPITLRDAGALLYVLTREWYSLRAIPLLLHVLPKAWAVRKALQCHRRVSPRELRSWISYRPVAKSVA